MIRAFIILAGFVSIAAFAQTQEWKFDSAHSSIHFGIDHLTIAEVAGKFDDYQINVRADKNDFSDAKFEVLIQTASINTGVPQRDEHLKSPDFFNVAKNPTIKFVGKKFEKQKNGTYKIFGALTLNGVTKDIVLDGKLSEVIKDPWGSERVGLRLSGKLDRYDYGMKYNSILETGGLVIGKEVRINGSVELTKVEK
jgi:polyisoprenoid-binding protein YceI